MFQRLKLLPRTRSAWHLARLARRLKNWRPVWAAYVANRPVPELHLRNGVRLRHGPADAPVFLLFEIFSDGVYRRHVRGGFEGTVIDIGANIGATAIDLAVRNPQLTIHSYEPNPVTREVLTNNITGNALAARVRVFAEAVGGGDGVTALWIDGPSLAATGYKAHHTPTDGAPIEVPTVGLATCLSRVVSPVCLLKIDAEGAEAAILEGLDADRWAAVRNVALEYHDDLCPHAAARCRAVLERAGFTCRDYPAEPNRGMLYAWRDG